MPGKHYGLQDHSVSDFYPISVVGVGDQWEVHNLETGERMAALSLNGPGKYITPSCALSAYRYNRRNGLLEWLPAEDRQALLKKYAEEARSEAYSAALLRAEARLIGRALLGEMRYYGSVTGRITFAGPPQSIPKFGWVSRVDPNDEPVTAGVPVIAFTEEATKPQPDGVTGWRVLAMHDID